MPGSRGDHLPVTCSLAKRGIQHPEPESDLGQKRLFLGDNGNLVVGILPVSIFANGHTFFVSRMHEKLGLDPYVVHATFQFSGTPGKRNRLRERLLWKDPPEYFDPGYGFVTWEMDVPEQMRAAAPPLKPTTQCCEQQQGHFDAMNHQLLQVRSGLAVASVCPCLLWVTARDVAGAAARTAAQRASRCFRHATQVIVCPWHMPPSAVHKIDQTVHVQRVISSRRAVSVHAEWWMCSVTVPVAS